MYNTNHSTSGIKNKYILHYISFKRHRTYKHKNKVYGRVLFCSYLNLLHKSIPLSIFSLSMCELKTVRIAGKGFAEAEVCAPAQ